MSTGSDAPRPIRRRTLLAAIGGAGLAASGLTAVGLAAWPTLQRTPRRALRVLDGTTFSILAAVADRVCPATASLPSAWDLEVPEQIDDMLYGLHEDSANELLLALRLLDNGLLGIIDGRIRPFTRCDGEAQDRILARWRDSRVTVRRATFLGVTRLAAAAYWSNPATFAHVGYPGPPVFARPAPPPASAP